MGAGGKIPSGGFLQELYDKLPSVAEDKDVFAFISHIRVRTHKPMLRAGHRRTSSPVGCKQGNIAMPVRQLPVLEFATP